MFKAACHVFRKSTFQITPTPHGFFAKRAISWYPKQALPILPLVAGPHKWLTMALQATHAQLPKEFVDELQSKLAQIRAVPWNGLEEDPFHPKAYSYRSGKRLLEELLQFESRLPEPLCEALSKIADRNVSSLFDFIRTGIEHIEFHRQHPNVEELRNSNGYGSSK